MGALEVREPSDDGGHEVPDDEEHLECEEGTNAWEKERTDLKKTAKKTI